MPGKRKKYLSWDEVFMGSAILVSARSKDPSNQVGACIVDQNHRILSLGYNGLTTGMNDDDFYWNSIGEKTGEIDKIKDYYIVHAERNAILNYCGSHKDLTNSTLYVTWFPCTECTKEIIQTGIKRIVYLRMYSKPEMVNISKTMLEKAGVEIIPYQEEKDFTQKEIQTATEQIQTIIKNLSK